MADPVANAGANAPSAVTAPAFLVLLSGAVGGLVYWVLQVATGISPFGFPWYGGIPASLLVGGVAAFLGVYLLANSDTTSRWEIKHTLSFALVCGMTWSTVLAGAKQQVASVTGSVKADTSQNQTTSLQNSLNSGDRTEVSAKLPDVGQAAAQAMQALSSTADDQVKTKILANSQDAVKTIIAASKVDPAKGIDALRTVGTNATGASASGIRLSVVDALTSIEKTNPELAQQAMAARQAVTTQ